jgi:two-component system, chemotaxis family, CheB/CheR fusion protein
MNAGFPPLQVWEDDGGNAVEDAVSMHTGDAPLIVAVACSASDLSAPSELVSALPADCGAAFVFVQQPSSGRDRLLAESLAGRTTLPVVHAYDGIVAEHDHIYVIPPSASPTMIRRRVHLVPAASDADDAADTLFTSLARELGGSAIGVILSGGGSERALGIQAIRRAGGTTFAQFPGSARFPNLPISAIDTGAVDFVLRPSEIARELARISRQTEKVPRRAFEHTHTQVGRLGPIITRECVRRASTP